jgi:hypothetical protein
MPAGISATAAASTPAAAAEAAGSEAAGADAAADSAEAAAEDSAVLLPPQAASPSINAAAETVMQAARARVDALNFNVCEHLE